jgi:hypothetical protein
MTHDHRRTLLNLDVQRRIREAHALRIRYIAVMLRALARSARSHLGALASILGRRSSPPTAARRNAAAPPTGVSPT